MTEPGQAIRPEQELRCDVRLQNDALALEALSSDRMNVSIQRFGPRVVKVDVVFPRLRTAFLNMNKEVEVHQVSVLAKIRPNAGDQFPYPLGAPEVRIYFQGGLTGTLIPQMIPYVSGLFWFDPGRMAETISNLPLLMQPILSNLPQKGASFGIPCLWRKWTDDCDLIFVARQIHRMLTDPGGYSPTDCMNEEAAFYWATHKDRLPLESSIPELNEIVGDIGKGILNHADSAKKHFFLKEVR